MPKRDHRFVRLGLVLLVVALAVILAALTFDGSSNQSKEFCRADERIGPNGETYRRDPEQDCKFVDASGDPLPDQ